jgi:hypothetical protein
VTTVRELIEELSALQPDDLVVLAKDPEGNGYSPFSGADPCVYVPESTWSGYLWDDEEPEPGWESEKPAEAVNAVVLWPIN